ncbi:MULTISPECIES: hypothetical protein [Caballeronia]|uniref:Uncharacterized protein n=1 Tax=Caballeronia jiangsuensis TaxID=1458357 RepID=A0ABW9CGF5_9BURK|nr:hypothetical protein [Caballeronia sp. GaOx3]
MNIFHPHERSAIPAIFLAIRVAEEKRMRAVERFIETKRFASLFDVGTSVVRPVADIGLNP